MISSDECKNSGTVSKILRIDFQPMVDEWVAAAGGKTGVAIYDLDLGEMVGAYNADTKMRIESIYKLFVVYEGYRRVQNGGWSLEQSCGATGWTVKKCLDAAIRDSSSTAAEALWGMIGRDTLDTAVQNDFGLPGVVVGSISATPREVMTMMKRFYEHPDITDATLVALMKDSFLNQPPSAGLCAGPCDWRRGLPSGFSDEVNVYNKVGWLGDGAGGWVYYDDAAIIDFVRQDRQYVVVILTSRVSNKMVADFGTRFERYFLAKNQ